MKRPFVIVLGLLAAVAVQAQGDPNYHYLIQPAGGATEPLNPGNSIEVYNSDSRPEHTYSDAYFEFYHQGIFVGIVHVDNSTYHLNEFGQVVGDGVLEVGEYTWANGVKVRIITVFSQNTYTWTSDNMLQVANATVITPSLSGWGLAALLILIPGIMVISRRFSRDPFKMKT